MSYESVSPPRDPDAGGFGPTLERWLDDPDAWDLRAFVEAYRTAPKPPQSIQKRSGNGPGRKPKLSKPPKPQAPRPGDEVMSYEELARRLERYCC